MKAGKVKDIALLNGNRKLVDDPVLRCPYLGVRMATRRQIRQMEIEGRCGNSGAKRKLSHISEPGETDTTKSVRPTTWGYTEPRMAMSTACHNCDLV